MGVSLSAVPDSPSDCSWALSCPGFGSMAPVWVFATRLLASLAAVSPSQEPASEVSQSALASGDISNGSSKSVTGVSPSGVKRSPGTPWIGQHGLSQWASTSPEVLKPCPHMPQLKYFNISLGGSWLEGATVAGTSNFWFFWTWAWAGPRSWAGFLASFFS